jgi:hypothetical protein
MITKQPLSREEQMNVDCIINKLRETMPPAFVRKEIPRLLGGILTVGTIANLDAAKQGPPKLRLKRHVVYEKDSFLEWFKKYLNNKKISN